MASSLEARSPFLDHHLMEFAARLETRHKRRGRTGKVALRRLARGWLPDEVIDRPKRGFGVPMANWLRGELRPLARELLTDATARRRGWFRPDSVDHLLGAHDRGDDHSTRIWNLLVLEAWSRRWLDA
jgi:asparagine synthase (glutamine-hydrolysing)